MIRQEIKNNKLISSSTNNITEVDIYNIFAIISYHDYGYKVRQDIGKLVTTCYSIALSYDNNNDTITAHLFEEVVDEMDFDKYSTMVSRFSRNQYKTIHDITNMFNIHPEKEMLMYECTTGVSLFDGPYFVITYDVNKLSLAILNSCEYIVTNLFSRKTLADTFVNILCYYYTHKVVTLSDLGQAAYCFLLTNYNIDEYTNRTIYNRKLALSLHSRKSSKSIRRKLDRGLV